MVAQDKEASSNCMGASIQISDFVGNYGAYQLYISLLLFLRYVFLGLMANSGPLMTPDVTFYCQLPMEEIVSIMPNITTLNQTEQDREIKEEFKRICQLNLQLYQPSYLENSSIARNHKLPQQTTTSTGDRRFNASERTRECSEFTYELAADQGRTMTSEFNLVCDRDWLRGLFQSLLSAAIVVAHVFWGTFSDKYGRFTAQKLCIFVSLVAGCLSMIAADFWTFTVTRALCSFGDLGLVVSLTTTIVELVGSNYRGISVAMVNFGFALGVAILPYIVAYFEDFRKVVAFTVVCHLVTVPFVWGTTGESIRWLLSNRDYEAAEKELKRIKRWNRTSTCSIMPLFGLIRRRTGTACQDSESVSSSSSEKKAFKLLLKQFIQQMESNHLEEYNEHENSMESPEFSARVSANKRQPKNDIIRPVTEKRHQSDHQIYHLPTHDNHPLTGLQNITTSNQFDSKIDDHLFKTSSCSQLEGVKPFDDGLKFGANTVRLDNGSPDNASSMIRRDPSSLDLSREAGGTLARRRQQAQQPDCINLVANQLSFVGRVNRLFRDKQLMIVVFTIVWTTFNSELLYTSFIIINLEVGEDVYLNYILGGCMEALAAISASLLLSYASRRHTLITFWLLISLSCFGLSVAHIDSTWAVWILALAKFSQSCLSSVASVAAYESFPTSLRQSGSGLVFTMGMLGSVFAPLIFAEFDDQARMDRVLMTFSFSSLTAAILIHRYLKETSNCELK